MKFSYTAVFVLASSFAGAVSPVFADLQDDARAEMAEVIDDLNDDSYKKFHAAISERDMKQRILGNLSIGPDVAGAFAQNFDASMESWLSGSFPVDEREDIIGALVDFKLDGASGTALVRYELPNYRYSYHLYELQVNKRGRVTIVDWLDYLQAHRLSVFAGHSLVWSMPNEMAIRGLLTLSPLNSKQIFQTRELLKAYRDSAHDRFFDIVDDMDAALRDDPFIVDLNAHVALLAQDSQRYDEALLELLAHYSDNALYALTFVDYYMWSTQYDRALEVMQTFQEAIGIDDGATLSRMSALALATGDAENAVAYAARATAFEPELELGWWSLLRAQSSSADFPGATETLTRLEEGFGHRLDAVKLMKDRFRGFTKLAASQEFKDWRAARD